MIFKADSFEGVAQEILLAVYRDGKNRRNLAVDYIFYDISAVQDSLRILFQDYIESSHYSLNLMNLVSTFHKHIKGSDIFFSQMSWDLLRREMMVNPHKINPCDSECLTMLKRFMMPEDAPKIQGICIDYETIETIKTRGCYADQIAAFRELLPTIPYGWQERIGRYLMVGHNLK